MCCTCKNVFLLIRPILVFNRSPALPSPLSITRFYIFFEQTITNIIESSASYISVVHCCCSFYFGDYDDNSMAPIWRDATGLCIGTVYFFITVSTLRRNCVVFSALPCYTTVYTLFVCVVMCCCIVSVSYTHLTLPTKRIV